MKALQRLNLVNLASVLITVVAGTHGGLASLALADDLKCNREQTRCLATSTQMTIGDRVGIFNKDDELVALGEVQAMKGDRRAVLINERHGQINRGYSLALLEKSPSDPGFKSAYKIYRQPATYAVGADMGLATVGIGEGSPAMELSAYGSWRQWRGIQAIGRVTYLGMSGKISGYDNDRNFGSRPISVSGFGMQGGAAYVLRENQPVSFRGELGLGLMYVKASIDGDPSLISDDSYNPKVNNGFGIYSRASVGAMYNMSDWHLHLALAGSAIHRAFATTLMSGVSMDIK